MTADPQARTSRGGRAGWWLALLAVTVLGGTLRLGVAQATQPLLVGDEHYYLEVARSLASGGGHHSARLDAFAAWPPGQAAWLAAFLPDRIEDPSPPPRAPQALATAQALLGTLLVAGVGLLGRLLAGPRAGLVAAAGAALYPTLVAFSHYLWATTLFTTLIVFAWCGVLLAERRGAVVDAAGAGVLFGLAALTRETGAALALGSALWLCWRAAPPDRLRAVGQAALLLALCALVVLPWTLRNLERTGRVIPVSTVGWMALREGNTFDPDDWMRRDLAALSEFRRRYYALPEAQRSDLARAETIALVRAEQPRWPFVKLVRNLAWLSSPDSFLLRKLRLGAYDPLPQAWARAILVATVASWAVALVLGCLGLTLAGRAGSFALFAALPLLALHVLANASTRYRLPLVPLLLVGSAIAATRWRELRAGLLRPRVLPALALLLLFFAVAVPRFVPDALALWNRGPVAPP